MFPVTWLLLILNYFYEIIGGDFVIFYFGLLILTGLPIILGDSSKVPSCDPLLGFWTSDYNEPFLWPIFGSM